MKRLHIAGEYFSMESMQERDPLLYRQYIGQFLEEQGKRKSADMNLKDG